ncbi:MAG: OmpA family protein, partial [Myxococcota bacterium]
ADFAVPTGGKAAWVAEEGIRFSPGVVAGLDLGRVGVLADAGITARRTVTTTDALAVGTEVTAALGATVAVVPETLDAYAGALGRFGVTAGAGAGSAAMEALVGAQLHALPVLDVDLAAGRGLTRGYGGTAYRVLASVTFHAKPPVKAVVADAAPAPSPYPTDDVLDISGLEEAPEPEPEVAPVAEAPLARVEQKQIVIRDPLQFERNTDRILAESLDTLAVVARLMNENPDITQLIIEGHASGEGSYAHNYKLSVARALAVFQALVEAGVHPSRMACRGWGEVSPAVQGEGDAALAANRRVMFHIAHRLAPGEANPGWATALTLPWNGAAHTLPAPPPPPPVVAAPPTPAPRPATTTGASAPEFNPADFEEKEDEQ